MDTVSNNDPTGFVPAALAAIKLVGAVAQVAPHVKKSVDNYRNNNSGAGAQVGAGVNRPANLNDPAAALTLQVDPERESRAYETVNYVLRTLGNRIGEAGLVSAPALAKALTAAATHIEVELFSVNANRLFKSLASKLKDAVLVNSVFTSIYFIGAITAELSSSLPQYKASYPPLGPFIIQQIFRAAIGEDAFRENITANLDAYKTLATTAGLLRPTDIGYSIFPGFPSLSPTRYSAKSFADVRNHKNIFQALVKHFDFHGFPQPKPGLDVGPIKDWRFLSGDANSKWYEVEKADKHIGEAIGRVLYWLICSADRMPPGMAVIAYYKQHIELIQWMGSRFGYRVLTGKQHLDLSGPHLRLENKHRATIEAWVIIMPSETAQLNKQQAAAQWNHINQPQPAASISPSLSNASTSHGRLSMSSSISSVDNASMPPPKPGGNSTAQPNGASRSIGIGSAIAHAGAAARKSESYPKPSGAQPVAHSTLSSPGLPAYTETPTTVASPTEQSTASTPVTSTATEFSTSAAEPFSSADYGHPAANLPAHLSHSSVSAGTNHTPPRAHPGAHHASNSLPQPPNVNYTPPLSNASNNPAAAPPSYFPPFSSQTSGNSMNPSQPLVNNRAQPAVRRRAPPPPPKFPLARALYDFGPEEEDGEELLFHEGDELEIVEKSEDLEADGWCKARLKGTTHVGLAPLEYLEEIKVVKKAPPPPGGAARARMVPGPANTVPTQVSARSLSGGQSPSGRGVPQSGAISRSLSSASVSGRPHGAMKPHLIGIHENPHPHPIYHPNPNYHQNPNGRPQSGVFQNPHPHPHSYIPVNTQMQHDPYAHPVYSTHPELPGQQHSESSQRPPSYAPQGPQEFPSDQGPTKPQSNMQQTSHSGSGIAGQKPSQSNDIKVDVQINTPSQRPTSTQQAPATQTNQATPGQQGAKLRPQANRPAAGQAPNGRLTNQQAAGLNVAANLSLNLAGGGRPNQQQGLGQNPNHMQNNSAENQNYGSASGNVGAYSDNSTYNPSMQAERNYGPNAGYMQPTDTEPPMMYGTSGYYDSGYDAGAGTLAGEIVLAEGVNPSSFISSVTDLASIDPFYAQMNPEFTSDASTTDATEGYDGADPGVDESTSALAGLGLDAGGSSTMEQSAATDSLGFGVNAMESPLAGLAPQDDASGGDRSAGGDGSGFDAGVSPLAGLAPPDDASATSAADLGASMDHGAAFDDGTSGAYDTMAAAQIGAEMEEAGYANACGLIDDTTYEQEETTTTSLWSSMGDDDDDGFGYS